MTFREEVPWLPTDSQEFDQGRNIAVPEHEYQAWKQPGFHVLEVGTGTNASAMRELLKDGISAIGLEPGLNYNDDKDRCRSLREDPQLKKRIVGLNAVDAIDHPLMLPEGVDVIFAQNINFAQYVFTIPELLTQIHGLLSCLSTQQKESYLTFESLDHGLIFTTRGEHPTSLDLGAYLDQRNARWTVRENKYGMPYVVIYRTNAQGQDLVERFIKQS